MLLLHHLRLAADRGVRVRVLVDDLNTAGEDRRFMHLSEHAHIEVRVFNPFPGGRFATWTRFVASASDIPRINHRMHNKLFIADNAIAITGGRDLPPARRPFTGPEPGGWPSRGTDACRTSCRILKNCPPLPGW